MATDTIPFEETHEETFQTGQVLSIVGGHLVHDIYTAFVPTLLPVMIEKLSLSLTLAGSLTAIQQIPALLNPFIGYLADRASLRYFVILAPAATATLTVALGWAPNYLGLAILFFAIGITVAAFHAPAPAMIGRISGRKLGLGMSLFMAGGELARSIGPLFAVWAVSTWSFEGIYRSVALGYGASLVLFWRLRNVKARTARPGSLRAALPLLRSLFLPLVILNLLSQLMLANLSTYLPTFLSQEGATLATAGASLALLEFAGVGGALLSGMLSDRLGRKPVLLIATTASAVFMLLFLQNSGWIASVVLAALGFTAFATNPVILALVQEHMPRNRAVGNGLYMTIIFLTRTAALLVIGVVGDRFGLRPAFYAGAFLTLLSVPVIFFLPEAPDKKPGLR